jgi:hypothetical protein
VNPRALYRRTQGGNLTTKTKALAAGLAVILLGVLRTVSGPTTTPPAAAGGADTVHVAPPTGVRDADRVSILAALEQVQPDGTVLFAAGTYLMGGEIIRIATRGTTLLGHVQGTTLRGCDPAEFERHGSDAPLCNGLELAGGQQKVRGLTFEYAGMALHVGCCWSDFPYMRASEGGHIVEGNTFRNSAIGIRIDGYWLDPSLVRSNRFLNNWHAVHVYGGTVHLLENEIAAPEPRETPRWKTVWDAVFIGSPMPLQDGYEMPAEPCANNIIEGNRVEGYADGIVLAVWVPGLSCRGNVIRGNTIRVGRVPPPADDTGASYIGTPLALANSAEAFRRMGLFYVSTEGRWSRSPPPGESEPVPASVLEDNLIEGNHIIGAEGVGLEVLHASRNRIVNNTFTRVRLRDPFPGKFFGVLPELNLVPDWQDANGSAIWVSPGSDENQIIASSFADIAAYAVYVNGDRNVIETQRARDSVYDLGTGNQVRGSDATTPGSLR